MLDSQTVRVVSFEGSCLKLESMAAHAVRFLAAPISCLLNGILANSIDVQVPRLTQRQCLEFEYVILSYILHCSLNMAAELDVSLESSLTYLFNSITLRDTTAYARKACFTMTSNLAKHGVAV